MKIGDIMNYNLIQKGIIYLKKNLLFFNIKNKNIQNLAYREYCYTLLSKKYSKIINNFDYKQHDYKYSDYVWICWLQGIQKAPPIVKACINSAKVNLKNKKIIILDENNIENYYVFPKYIEVKRKKGIISPAHYTDLLRLCLLTKYGGLWIDATVLVTGKPDNNFFKHPLFVYQNISLDQKNELSVKASNWLIYSCKNNPILLLTKKLLFEYWKKENKAINYNIFHLFFTMSTKKYNSEWKEVPLFSNIPPHILQFELLKKYDKKRWDEITKMSKFHKLNHRILNFQNDSFANYIIGDYNGK